MDNEHLIRSAAAALLFALIGLGVFAAGFWLVRKIVPFDVYKEIEQDQNTALAILIGSFILGLALIISAAIHG